MTTNTPTVLAVDDDAGLLDLYEAWLGAEYRVVTARDGREALNELDDTVEVVVLDRDMPRLGGDEFLRTCRRQGWDCRVLMVTGAAPDEDVLELGFDGYLTKPVERETLLNHVAMLFRRQDYSASVKELYAVTSKIALVDSHELENGDSDLFDQLVERRRTLESVVDRLLSEFQRQDFEAEYHRITSLGAAD